MPRLPLVAAARSLVGQQLVAAGQVLPGHVLALGIRHRQEPVPEPLGTAQLGALLLGALLLGAARSVALLLEAAAWPVKLQPRAAARHPAQAARTLPHPARR
ncbi:MAG: hypothetical protein ABW321_25220 [Polyangiales bacterium]